MLWALYVLALVLAYLAHTTVPPTWMPEWLDLLLVIALVCGLTAPAAEARLAGWITGLAQDIGTVGPLGLHAFTLGLAALLLTLMRDAVNRTLWWVRSLLAFVAAVPAQVIIVIHYRYYQFVESSWWSLLSSALLTAIAAAVIAATITGLPSMMGRKRRRRSAPARW